MIFLIASTLLASLLASPDFALFNETEHDFGAVEAVKETLEWDYSFVNVSNHEIRISSAVSSCSCTKLAWTTDVVEPGDSGFVHVNFTRQYDKEYFAESLRVFFEDATEPVVLSFKGSFFETECTLGKKFPFRLGPIAFESEFLDIGKIIPGVMSFHDVRVANVSSESLGLSFSSLPEGMELASPVYWIGPYQVSEIKFCYTPGPATDDQPVFVVTPLVDGGKLQPLRLVASY